MERLNAVLPIRDIFSRVILNCCGQSALETDVLAGEDVVGRVSVPGNGREDPAVQAEAEYINTVIAGELTGENIFDQERIDGILSQFERRSETLFCVSAAAASAAAAALKLPLYRYLGGVRATRLPVPEIRLTEENPDPGFHVRVGQTATLGELSGQIRKAQAERIPVIFCCSEGETADTLLTDLAVAYGADRIDAGPARHMEYVEKYNRLLRIREKLEMQLTEEK